MGRSRGGPSQAANTSAALTSPLTAPLWSCTLTPSMVAMATRAPSASCVKQQRREADLRTMNQVFFCTQILQWFAKEPSCFLCSSRYSHKHPVMKWLDACFHFQPAIFLKHQTEFRDNLSQGIFNVGVLRSADMKPVLKISIRWLLAASFQMDKKQSVVDDAVADISQH